MAMIARGPINIVAAGMAFSAALVVLYALCAVAELIFPNVPLAHGWLALFSRSPSNTAAAWTAGVIGSIAFGWITAVVTGLVYNAAAAK
jgi:hypothetical protein